jgi:zinc finger protein ubi-d4
MALKVSATPLEMNINCKSIEKLLNDSAYRELIEISANFNTRLCVERKLRMPFHDPQTGVAQRSSNLYMKRTQRMPGFQDGQVYSYPSFRWRNKKNSHKLSNRPFFRFRVNDNPISSSSSSMLNPISHINPTATLTATTNSSNGIVNDDGQGSSTADFQAIIDAESNSLTGGADTDSKDSQEIPKDWYYDDMDANDGVSEEAPDSDFDYNINGYKRKKKAPVRKSSSRKPKESISSFGSESTPASSSSRSGGGGSKNRGGNSRSRSKNNKKGTTTNSRSKSNKNEKSKSSTKPAVLDDEPPSFESVQDKLNDGSSDSFAYRNF